MTPTSIGSRNGKKGGTAARQEDASGEHAPFCGVFAEFRLFLDGDELFSLALTLRKVRPITHC